MKSRIVAAVLAWFLGTLGIHQFYVGNTKRGLIYLLVSVITCGFGAIVIWILSIVDMVKYLQCKDDEEFNEKYVKKHDNSAQA